MSLRSIVLQRVFQSGPGERHILELDLNRGVLTAPPNHPLEALRAINSPTMAAVRDGLRSAATDEAVLGLVVHVGDCPLTLAEAEELADLIAGFTKAKPTIAWTESFGELVSAIGGYQLATSCSEVWVQPSGQVGIAGLHAGITLLKGLVTKAGVEPQFSQRHEYKSAGEQFSADEISDANREMIRSLVDSMMNSFVETVAARRALSTEQVWEAVNSAPLTAEQAQQSGLIDHIGYRDQLYGAAFRKWSATPEELTFVHRYNAGQQRAKAVKGLVDRHQPVVAVVHLRGNIVTGRGRPGGTAQAAADVVTDHLRAAGRDHDVKAVVLRINSGGGSAVASDTIWRAVHQLREGGRPVVAQMGDYAASGGYYSAMGADEIIALPSTLTGSIGVVGGKFVTHGMFQKLGLVHEGFDAGANAGWLASDEYFTDHHWQILNDWLDRVYAEFTAKAAADRGMELDQLDALARGRVWTGAQALEHGLVNHLGGLDLAVDRACELSGVRRVKVHLKRYPALGMLERIRPAESTESSKAAMSMPLPTSPEALLRAVAARLGMELPGALSLPWRIDIR